MSQEKERPVPVNVAARFSGKSEDTVRRWVREGKVDYIKSSPRKTLIFKSSLEACREEF